MAADEASDAREGAEEVSSTEASDMTEAKKW